MECLPVAFFRLSLYSPPKLRDEHKFGSVEAHAEDLDAADVAHKQLGRCWEFTATKRRVIEFSIFFHRCVAAIWLMSCVEFRVKHLDAMVFFVSDEKTVLGVDGDLVRRFELAVSSASAAYCVTLVCRLGRRSPLDGESSVADQHLAAAVETDRPRIFQHVLAERAHKLQRHVEHAHTSR